jgi:hypothetical protein
VTVDERWLTIQSAPNPAARPVGESTVNFPVTLAECASRRVSWEKQVLPEHRYGSKLGTHTDPSATAIASARPGTAVIAVTLRVLRSTREIVPVV